ncbi:MAG: DUF4340 domain-containing protein [Ruminococcaceae bacterium]|nr:DUF4340 domain-containing protein [Oscillospiraceae bacterium]
MSLDHLNETQPVQPENNDAEIYNVFEETNPPVFDDKPQKVDRLTLSLIIASIVIVLLLCGYLGIKLLGDDGEPTESRDDTSTSDQTEDTNDTTEGTMPEPDTTVTLLDKSDKGKTVLRRVDFKNENGSFTIYYNEDDGNFLIKGCEDILLSSEVISLLKEYTTEIIAMDQVKEPGALKDYGLDKPNATAVITYADGSKATLKLGDELPTGDGYYGVLEGKEGVYMFDTDSASLFRFRNSAFADTTLIVAPAVKSDDTYGSALLKEIRYTGKNFKKPMVLRRSYKTDGEELQLFSYVITEPYPRGTTDEASGYYSSFKGLSASHALYLHPTAEQKKKLGFNDPLANIQFTMAVETSESDDENAPNTYYNATTTKLTVGSINSDGDYIVMVEGIDAIFLLEKSTFSNIADRTYENTVNELLFLKSIDQLGRITIEIDGKTTDFELNHYPGAENLDDQMQVLVGEEMLSTPDFRELYQLLMGLARLDSLDAMPEGTPVMNIKMYTTEGTFYMGATYHSISGTLCAVQTSEGEIFTTRWRNVTHFMEQVTNILNGDKVLIMTY